MHAYIHAYTHEYIQDPIRPLSQASDSDTKDVMLSMRSQGQEHQVEKDDENTVAGVVARLIAKGYDEASVRKAVFRQEQRTGDACMIVCMYEASVWKALV
jgi:hypothetical protein